MEHTTPKQAFVKLLALVTLCFAAWAFTPNAGLDSYEIYLNNKLMLKQYVNQPLSLRKLQLDKAEVKDRLVIYYRHCEQPGVGTGRSITIKDERGATLKQWKFADVTGADKGMTIPVKELLALEKSHAGGDLSLHYTAQERPKGEMLAALRFGAKITAYN